MPFFDLNLYVLAAVAVLYGYIEQHIYSQGYRDYTYHLFGKLSLRYHVPMLAMWACICQLAGHLWFFPAFAVIEDLSYFAFDPTDALDKDDWVNFGLGGLGLFGRWVPTVHLVGIVLSIILGMYHYGVFK